MSRHHNETNKTSRAALRWGAAGLAVGLMALPVAAVADDAVIWGRQTGLGKFMTEKVNLTAQATITSVTYEGGGNRFCIWSGGRPEVYLCWDKGDATLVGTVLPPNIGYFAIPGKRTENTPAYVQITVAY